MDENGEVRSNYGWQWKRKNQLDYIINKLMGNPSSRHAAITIYDAKEWPTYTHDTPCTYAVQFTILNHKLNMSVQEFDDSWVIINKKDDIKNVDLIISFGYRKIIKGKILEKSLRNLIK